MRIFSLRRRNICAHISSAGLHLGLLGNRFFFVVFKCCELFVAGRSYCIPFITTSISYFHESSVTLVAGLFL
jgi:hypothetical protein